MTYVLDDSTDSNLDLSPDDERLTSLGYNMRETKRLSTYCT